MSAYKGHRGVNVSQYVQQLNTLSPPQALLDEPLPSEDDFSAFLNIDFQDINNGPIADFDSPIDLDADLGTTAQQSQSSLGNTSRKHSLHTAAEPNMEFNMNGKHTLSLLSPAQRSCLCPSLRPTWSQRSILLAGGRPMTAGCGACKPRPVACLHASPPHSVRSTSQTMR
jgi:hypothetical protein